MHIKRSISPFALLLTSVSAIVGSGWLFSAFYTAKIAGPAAVLSWLIGCVFILIVAFVFAELCSMLPISGSSARIPQYTHGTMVSFIFAWMIWLSYLAIMAIETQAVVQYLSFYFPDFTYPTGGLTHHGYVLATIIMLLVSAINIYSVRWLVRLNSFLTLIKILIPLIVIVFVFKSFFHFHEVFHPITGSFMPFGIHGLLGALSTGGILFAFNGFKQAAEMAGEAKKPSTAVPFAIIGSILIALIIYMGLQLSFDSSLTLQNLVNGWDHIVMKNDNSPVASMLDQDKLSDFLPLLYVGAIIAPLAACLMYCSSAARSLYGMSKNGSLPAFFQVLNPQGNPVRAIVINFVLGMCLFAPLPGWENMMSFLSSLFALTYAVGPICLLSLRQQTPNQARPFRLPFANVWATVAFYICTLLTYWSGWTILSKLGIALAVGWVILFIYCTTTPRGRALKLNWRSALWIWPYFIGISLISYLGDYGGGIGVLTMYPTLIIIAVFCVLIMALAVKVRLPDAVAAERVQSLHLEDKEDIH